MEPIVLDVGSGYTKAGYANPDNEPPLVSFPAETKFSVYLHLRLGTFVRFQVSVFPHQEYGIADVGIKGVALTSEWRSIPQPSEKTMVLIGCCRLEAARGW
jgi:hypothetical protein